MQYVLLNKCPRQLHDGCFNDNTFSCFNRMWAPALWVTGSGLIYS